MHGGGGGRMGQEHLADDGRGGWVAGVAVGGPELRGGPGSAKVHASKGRGVGGRARGHTLRRTCATANVCGPATLGFHDCSPAVGWVGRGGAMMLTCALQ